MKTRNGRSGQRARHPQIGRARINAKGLPRPHEARDGLPQGPLGVEIAALALVERPARRRYRQRAAVDPPQWPAAARSRRSRRIVSSEVANSRARSAATTRPSRESRSRMTERRSTGRDVSIHGLVESCFCTFIARLSTRSTGRRVEMPSGDYPCEAIARDSGVFTVLSARGYAPWRSTVRARQQWVAALRSR